MTNRPMLHTVTIGDARITLVRDGDMPVPAAELFGDEAHAAWSGGLPDAGEGQVVVPVHVALVQVGGEVVLIDTGLGAEPGDGGQGGGLGAALAELGLTPGDITRVVITHLHGDHLGGALDQTGDAPQPAFPNARHHLPSADWEWVEGFPEELRQQYLQPLTALPNLTLDAPDDRLTPALRSVGAPGHTPGHRCLVVESGGQTFCFLGDLVHQPALHFAEPERVTAWDAQPERTPPSRRAIAAQATAGDWLLAATHASPALGRLTSDGDERWSWQPIEHE